MQEIRFRAWDVEQKKFLDDIQDEWGGEAGGYPPFPFYLHNNNFVVELFTGLKDKNEKEIYEGDIVNVVRFNTICVVKFGEYDNGLMCEDNISGNGWYMERDVPTDYFLLTLYSEEEYEIVGNIHENMELVPK